MLSHHVTGPLSIRLERNDRFAILHTDSVQKECSVFDTTAYFKLYHVFARTEKSCLLFQCKLMDILADVNVEGNKKLDAEYKKRPYDLSWYKATRCGDGSISLQRGVETLRLEYGIQLSPVHLECTHSPRSSFSSDEDLSPLSPSFTVNPPAQEEKHRKGKLSLFSDHILPPERLDERLDEDPFEREIDLDYTFRMAEFNLKHFLDEDNFPFEP